MMGKPSRRKNREARKTSPGHKLNKQERLDLKHKRTQSLRDLRQDINATGSALNPRTQAHNRKSSAATIAGEEAEYEALMQAQIQNWRAILLGLLLKFSRMSDPRNPKKLKHKIAVVMMYGLFQFMCRIESRRAFNKQLTTASVFKVLHEFFPDIDSVPHADTIARLLERIELHEIENIQVALIKKLIRNKKFKKLLIMGYMPISIDATQKVVRNDQLEIGDWLVRTIHTTQGEAYQQYVLVVEANITFANGLTFPLLTEYCCLNDDDIDNTEFRQDCELKAYHRLSDKLKKYFPRLKIIVLLDNLYACEAVIADLIQKGWEFMIKLPAKLKSLSAALKEQRGDGQSIPGQPFWRERKQTFHWVNDVVYHGFTIHLVACIDKWTTVSRTTGDKVPEVSEHTWISSLPLSMKNIHCLCNLAGRNRALIEDSFNTEKNRGYQYQHIFSHDWNAMQGYHALMRLAHTINALSEFTRKLKKIIKQNGCAATLKMIFDAIKHNHLSNEWIKKQLGLTPQIRFDFQLP